MYITRFNLKMTLCLSWFPPGQTNFAHLSGRESWSNSWVNTKSDKVMGKVTYWQLKRRAKRSPRLAISAWIFFILWYFVKFSKTSNVLINFLFVNSSQALQNVKSYIPYFKHQKSLFCGKITPCTLFVTSLFHFNSIITK